MLCSLFFFQEAPTLDLWMALLSFPGYENSLIKPLLRHMVTCSLGFFSFNTVSAILTLSLRPGTVLGDKFWPSVFNSVPKQCLRNKVQFDSNLTLKRRQRMANLLQGGSLHTNVDSYLVAIYVFMGWEKIEVWRHTVVFPWVPARFDYHPIFSLLIWLINSDWVRIWGYVHTILNSFCSSMKIIPDRTRMVVAARFLWWSEAAPRRFLKVERDISDRFCAILWWQLVNTYSARRGSK